MELQSHDIWGIWYFAYPTRNPHFDRVFCFFRTCKMSEILEIIFPAWKKKTKLNIRNEALTEAKDFLFWDDNFCYSDLPEVY